MRINRIAVDVTRQAASAPVTNRVEFVSGLALAEVAACTEFAKHGVGRTVSQRLQVSGFPIGAIDYRTRRLHDASTGVHQTVADRRDLVGMAIAASRPGVFKQPRKAGHADVGLVLREAGVITAMANSAVVASERMRLHETAALAGMTLITGVTSLFGERRSWPAEKAGSA